MGKFGFLFGGLDVAKRGRKSAYETTIKPRFNEISEWLRNGATEKQVYENLGIGKDAFYKYKREMPEFNELIKKGRKTLVKQLRGALVKKAFGFQYVETKKIKYKLQIKYISNFNIIIPIIN